MDTTRERIGKTILVNRTEVPTRANWEGFTTSSASAPVGSHLLVADFMDRLYAGLLHTTKARAPLVSHNSRTSFIPIPADAAGASKECRLWPPLSHKLLFPRVLAIYVW